MSITINNYYNKMVEINGVWEFTSPDGEIIIGCAKHENKTYMIEKLHNSINGLVIGKQYYGVWNTDVGSISSFLVNSEGYTVQFKPFNNFMSLLHYVEDVEVSNNTLHKKRIST
jgi:hypothetical protein